MKSIFSAFMLIIFSFNLNAQTKAVKEKAKIEHQALIEEKKAEYITNIVNGLEIDEFQKHILTQQLNSYYDKLTKIHKLDISTFDKTTLIDNLNNNHFKDFEDMLGSDFVNKLLDKVKGIDRSDQKKKKKKKRKKKN